jgi:protein tyrosine phosphatase (PTP) superfamily phosphohydrolase (DUF442 family)
MCFLSKFVESRETDHHPDRSVIGLRTTPDSVRPVMNPSTLPLLPPGILFVVVFLSGCSSQDQAGTDSRTANEFTGPLQTMPKVSKTSETDEVADVSSLPRMLKSAHLPNAIQIHDKVISGGQPDGEEAFQELQERGIKTIISVDGAKPDLELAKKHGLKYIHLPHSYDGVPEQRGYELAKAVRDFEGPIYIHCHHGKHRSPAAAAVACVTVGLIEPAMASSILQLAGTNPNYRGLYESAQSARKLDAAVLDALKADFPESAELTPMAEAMVHLEHTQDRVKMIAAAGWKSPASHPEIIPAQEVLLLKEHFTELQRAECAAKETAGFQAMLRESESAAADLEAALMNWNESGAALPVPDALPTSFEKIAKNCVACHTQYRDVPLSEKQR